MIAVTKLGPEELTTVLKAHCASQGIRYVEHEIDPHGVVVLTFETSPAIAVAVAPAVAVAVSAPVIPAVPAAPAQRTGVGGAPLDPVQKLPDRSLSATELFGGDPLTETVYELGSVPRRSFPKEEDGELARLLRTAAEEKVLEKIAIDKKVGV